MPKLMSLVPEMPFEKMAEHSIDFWLQGESQRCEPLPVDRRSEPDADHHRQCIARRRPDQGTPGLTFPASAGADEVE